MKEEGGIAYIPRGHGNLFVSHEMNDVQVLYRSACIELYVIGGTTVASFRMCEECAIITGGEKACTGTKNSFTICCLCHKTVQRQMLG